MTALAEFDHRRGNASPSAHRSGSFCSCSDDDNSGVPGMIMTASLQTSLDDDADSLSSSWRSPRSIFGSYWSSPAHTKNLESDDADDDDDDDEVMARLKILKLPSMNGDDDDDDDDADEEEKSGAVAAKIVPSPVVARRPVERKKCLDDDTVDYQAALTIPKPPTTRTARRQILPTPPPPTAISSSLLRSRLSPHFLLTPLGGERNSYSTSALLPRRRASCLRKSRYNSCSVIPGGGLAGGARLHHGLRNDGHPNLRHSLTSAAVGGRVEPSNDPREGELKKSVSFYSTVSVFEFAVPKNELRGQTGWDRHFA